MKRLTAALIAVLAIAGSGADAQPASIGITFGDGSQGPLTGSVGPGVPQLWSTWSRVDMRGWPTEWANGWLTGVSMWGWGPLCSQTPTVIATNDSAGTAVAVTLVSYDPDNYWAYANYGSAASYSGPYAVSSPAGTYNEKYFVYGTSGNSGSTPAYLKIAGIPYSNYDLYIGAQNWHFGSITGALINAAGSVFTNLTGDLTLWAEHKHPYDQRFKFSYVQIVERTAEPPPALAISSVRAAGTSSVVEWTGAPDWAYTAEYTPCLDPLVPWSNLTGYVNVPGAEGPMSATDTNHPAGQGFYRVRMSQ